MTELIQQYYLTERNGALLAMIWGFSSLLVAFFLWKFALPNPLAKGLMIVMLAVGIFGLFSGIGYRVHCNNKIAESAQLSDQNSRALQQTEIVRMTGVLKSSYIGSLVLATVAIAVALGIIFLSSSLLLKGVAIGLLIFGTLLHTTEQFSMKQNADYKQKIENLQFE